MRSSQTLELNRMEGGRALGTDVVFLSSYQIALSPGVQQNEAAAFPFPIVNWSMDDHCQLLGHGVCSWATCPAARRGLPPNACVSIRLSYTWVGTYGSSNMIDRTCLGGGRGGGSRPPGVVAALSCFHALLRRPQVRSVGRAAGRAAGHAAGRGRRLPVTPMRPCSCA